MNEQYVIQRNAIYIKKRVGIIKRDEEGIFFEEKYDSNAYFCVIGARKAEAESKAYKRIVESFQSEGTKKIFQEEFKGYFKPAWEYKID